MCPVQTVTYLSGRSHSAQTLDTETPVHEEERDLSSFSGYLSSTLALVLTLVLGIVFGTLGSQRLTAQQVDKKTPLLKVDMTGVQGQEGYVVLHEMAPGITTAIFFSISFRIVPKGQPVSVSVK
jgi:hypothetical protein